MRLHGVRPQKMATIARSLPEGGGAATKLRRPAWRSRGGPGPPLRGANRRRLRVVSICTKPNGIDVGEALIAEGLAWAFVEYFADYLARADKWKPAAAVSPRPGCPIKGNINGGNAI